MTKKLSIFLFFILGFRSSAHADQTTLTVTTPDGGVCVIVCTETVRKPSPLGTSSPQDVMYSATFSYSGPADGSAWLMSIGCPLGGNLSAGVEAPFVNYGFPEPGAPYVVKTYGPFLSGSPPSWTPSVSYSGGSSTGATLTGYQPSVPSITWGGNVTVPSAIIQNGTQVVFAVLQNGQVVGTQYATVDPGTGLITAVTNTSVNTTSSGNLSLGIEVPGYANNANGGLNFSPGNTGIVPIEGAANGTNLSVDLANTTFTDITDLLTGAATNGGVVWTNPAIANGSYNATADPLTGATYQEGTNALAANLSEANRLLGIVANNTGNNTGNVSVTNFGHIADAANLTVLLAANTANMTAASEASDVANYTANLTTAWLPHNWIGPDATPSPSPAGLVVTITVGGHTINFNFDPAAYSVLVLLAPIVYSISYTLLLWEFGWFLANDMRKCIVACGATQQTRGNAIAAGTGAQITTLANGVFILTAIGVAGGVILSAAVTALASAGLSSMVANPAHNIPAGMLYIVSYFYPIGTAITVWGLRFAYVLTSFGAYIGVLVSKALAIG